MKQFTVRIQSKFNKIRHGPDPVQSKSSPMLISAFLLVNAPKCHLSLVLA